MNKKTMKPKNRSTLATLVGMTAVLVTGGCSRTVQNDTPLYSNIHIEQVVHLTSQDVSSPYLDLAIDYSFLNEAEGDTAATAINRHLQCEVLGQAYADLPPEEAVDSFKNDYIRDYRTEVGKLCVADSFNCHNNMNSISNATPFPTWYNRTYSLFTFMDEGRKGIINACTDIFVDTGGAHPNQWSRWMNFRPEDGSLITLTDAFPPHSHEGLKTLLLDALIRQQAEAHPEEETNTVDDLRQRGILRFTEMYIPHNFLLGKEAASFLYNRYDIAPYVEGSIVLELPYDEVQPYMNNELWN